MRTMRLAMASLWWKNRRTTIWPWLRALTVNSRSGWRNSLAADRLGQLHGAERADRSPRLGRCAAGPPASSGVRSQSRRILGSR